MIKKSHSVFLQILKECLFHISPAKFKVRILSKGFFWGEGGGGASLEFHGPPLITVKTDRLDFRGLDRG